MAHRDTTAAPLRRFQRWYVYAAVIVLSIPLNLWVTDVRRMLGRSYEVTSAAMEPTLLPGDYVVVAHLRPHGLSRNSVIVFNWPADDQDILLRVIGVAGDTLKMESGRLYVNGEPEPQRRLVVTEPDGPHPFLLWQRRYTLGQDTAAITPTRDNWGPLVVPAGSYFVLGDNRHASLDSRYRGFVLAEDVKYRVKKIYYSKRAGLVRVGTPVL
jgi:signal peptidase I